MAMTHEEIIEKAKVGGFVTVRLEILDVDHGDKELPLQADIEPTGWVDASNIIAIEPSPEAAAEKIARLEARIAELIAELEAGNNG